MILLPLGVFLYGIKCVKSDIDNKKNQGEDVTDVVRHLVGGGMLSISAMWIVVELIYMYSKYFVN